MLAMVLEKSGALLQERNLPLPEPSSDQVLIKVHACGVCRTDLHIMDGELPNLQYPIIPGHQIVGEIVKLGKNHKNWSLGDRVGVSWLGYSCGVCTYCHATQENLCDSARYTGYQINGGFAEYCLAYVDYCLAIPPNYSDLEAAPLLCAGLVGYRAYKKVQQGNRIGFYGFGSAAHVLIQIAVFRGQAVYAFTRPEDHQAQIFAFKLGAAWVGSSEDMPNEPLDGAIIFAPVGNLVPQALKAIRKGGTVVCAGIHMSDIPSFPYEILWGERTLCSIANLTRQDAQEFLKIAPQIPIKTTVQTFPLSQLNEALSALRLGKITGTAVILMN
jgi:alcohol dehydrogenase, propanol-preferring